MIISAVIVGVAVLACSSWREVAVQIHYEWNFMFKQLSRTDHHDAF